MICNRGIALAGALLPQPAIEQLFVGGRPSRIAGSIKPGKAMRVDGGYRVSGQWSWGSGIRHAEWLNAATLIESDGQPPFFGLSFFPAAQAAIHTCPG